MQMVIVEHLVLNVQLMILKEVGVLLKDLIQLLPKAPKIINHLVFQWVVGQILLILVTTWNAEQL
jgi:hypothetical protein